jgi:hypothetical protein
VHVPSAAASGVHAPGGEGARSPAAPALIAGLCATGAATAFAAGVSTGWLLLRSALPAAGAWGASGTARWREP